MTPHVARNDTHQGGSAIDGRTSRHAGYGISQMKRKRIEEHFGWGKTVGRIRQTVYRGVKRVDQHFKLTMLASNPDSNCANADGGAARSDAMSRLSAAAAQQRAGYPLSGAAMTIYRQLGGQSHTESI